MIKSMTGFSRFSADLKDKKLTVEIKSLNSKQLDLNIKLPSTYKDKELDLRSLISKQLVRGKIEVCIYVEFLETTSKYNINKALFSAYYTSLKTIAQEINADHSTDYINTIMRLPDIVQSEINECDEQEWQQVKTIFSKAIQEVEQHRESEGNALQQDIVKRIATLQFLLQTISEYEKERISLIKERILKNLSEIVDKNQMDTNRFEQELIYYLEKLDITEERIRMQNHLNYFMETIQNENEQGRKLGFITQEIGREINTIGSKANHTIIQKLVIQAKDELEKIKEQLMNIL